MVGYRADSKIVPIDNNGDDYRLQIRWKFMKHGPVKHSVLFAVSFRKLLPGSLCYPRRIENNENYLQIVQEIESLINDT
ncbi:unnamed protein product [Nezara viridula]|uniref:Uncharacterized protein n=1 Tax=Nezara viridula TaxID=85310 RepID=A0A9P0H6G9_NEZVI|nr:unnamed protein product [Nezara viridula]